MPVAMTVSCRHFFWMSGRLCGSATLHIVCWTPYSYVEAGCPGPGRKSRSRGPSSSGLGCLKQHDNLFEMGPRVRRAQAHLSLGPSVWRSCGKTNFVRIILRAGEATKSLAGCESPWFPAAANRWKWSKQWPVPVSGSRIAACAHIFKYAACPPPAVK